MGWAGQLLVGALNGYPASFLWLCEDYPMDGTLITLNQMFLDKPTIGWSSGRAKLKK
jgi:hypothetical protein